MRTNGLCICAQGLISCSVQQQGLFKCSSMLMLTGLVSHDVGMNIHAWFVSRPAHQTQPNLNSWHFPKKDPKTVAGKKS